MERFYAHNGQCHSQTGKPNLLLSHGFGTDQTAWRHMLPWLVQHFDVISYDLAGCGVSGAQTYDFDRHSSLFGYADDLIEIMDELGLKKCHYIGHSMSAMIGAAAANARPDLFGPMVMIGASPRYLNDVDYIGGFEQPGLNQLFAAMAANYQAWITGFASAVVGVDSQQAVADFSRTLFQMRPDIALATSRVIFECDLRDLAARVPSPVTLIQTAEDMAVPLNVGTWLMQHIPTATLDIIPAKGHLPHITSPEAICDILERRFCTSAC